MSKRPLSGPFLVPPEVSWRDTAGELLLFDRRTETYHMLNQGAAEVWRRLAGGASVDGAIGELNARFQGADGIETDVRALTQALLDLGLLVPRSAE